MDKTKEIIVITCEGCGAETEIKTYRSQYIKDLINYSKRAHNALKQLIDSNKISAATKVYYPNSDQYETIGNIRAESPHKY